MGQQPGEPGWDLAFFFQMWDLKPISIYTLCSQEKNHVFSMYNKKPFGLNTSTYKDNIVSFQCGIWSPFVYILYVPKKKIMFLTWDKKPFDLNIST
jgi:hypothetical protein